MQAALRLCLILFVTLGAASLAPAQAPLGTVQTDFVLIDQDRLYAESAFGQRVVSELQAESEALVAENRRIEDALIAEEQSITERRATLSPEEFRALADEFDARVSGIRTAQERKARSLTSRDDQEQRRFFNASIPILAQLMQQYGAVAVLDRRSVFLSDDRIDITDEAIAAIDAAIGDGSTLTLETAPAPETPDSE